MDRWKVFSLLKGYKELGQAEVNSIYKANTTELREGIIEYLLWKSKTKTEGNTENESTR